MWVRNSQTSGWTVYTYIYLTWIEVHKLKILFLTIYDGKVCSFPHFKLISVLYLSIENALVNVLCSIAWTGQDEWVSQLGCSMHLGENELVFITPHFMVWFWSVKYRMFHNSPHNSLCKGKLIIIKNTIL